MKAPFLTTLVQVGLLSACSHAVRTNVDYKTVSDPDAKHYELAAEQSYAIPTPVTHVPPAYPAEMIPMGIEHVDVRVKVIVDEKGVVNEARLDGQTADHPPAFDDAVRSAVLTWRYTPFTIRTWKDVEDAEGNVVDAVITQEIAEPFSLDYVFSFDLHDGRPVVVGSQDR